MSWPAGLPNKKADSKITVTQDLIVYALRFLLCHEASTVGGKLFVCRVIGLRNYLGTEE